LFGYPLTILIAVIAALFLWTIANQVVENASPQPTVSSAGGSTTKTRIETPQPVCDVGPYEVKAGENRSILLNVKQGQRVKGHLAEIENQPFDWDIADENNMILLRKGERRKFKSIDGGRDDRAYTVRRKIPWPARWYLILDMYGKKIYPRHWQHSRSH